MAGTLRDRLRELENEKDRWFRERGAQAARLKDDLEHAGRDVWNAATRVGENIAARTPQELQALGQRVIDAGKRRAGAQKPSPAPMKNRPAAANTRPAVSPAPATGSAAANPLREALLQVDTAMGAAADTLTFGGADHLAAGLDALVEPGGLGGWRQRYEANLADAKARDRYDALNRPAARAIGQLGGTALGLGLVGPVEGAASALPRLPGAAALSGRETVALLGGGAATGAGMQAASDAATGRRSSAGDMGGAAVGGVAGAAMLPLGAGRAGAVDGWVTSVAQDVMNGRPISFERAGESAIAGGALGGLAGRGGRDASNGLSFQAKGRLGEAMGDIRSTINGQRREWAPKSRDQLPNGGHWYPDGTSGEMRFEDKFGYGARLSPNQIRAQQQLGDNFTLYHFTPDDVGRLVSMPVSAIAPQLVEPHAFRRE